MTTNREDNRSLEEKFIYGIICFIILLIFSFILDPMPYINLFR